MESLRTGFRFSQKVPGRRCRSQTVDASGNYYRMLPDIPHVYLSYVAFLSIVKKSTDSSQGICAFLYCSHGVRVRNPC